MILISSQVVQVGDNATPSLDTFRCPFLLSTVGSRFDCGAVDEVGGCERGTGATHKGVEKAIGGGGTCGGPVKDSGRSRKISRRRQRARYDGAQFKMASMRELKRMQDHAQFNPLESTRTQTQDFPPPQNIFHQSSPGELGCYRRNFFFHKWPHLQFPHSV